MMMAYLEQKFNLSNEQLVQVQFIELKRKPKCVIKDIYDRLGLHDYQKALPNFEKYLKQVCNHFLNLLFLLL